MSRCICLGAQKNKTTKHGFKKPLEHKKRNSCIILTNGEEAARILSRLEGLVSAMVHSPSTLTAQMRAGSGYPSCLTVSVNAKALAQTCPSLSIKVVPAFAIGTLLAAPKISTD